MSWVDPAALITIRKDFLFAIVASLYQTPKCDLVLSIFNKFSIKGSFTFLVSNRTIFKITAVHITYSKSLFPLIINYCSRDVVKVS